MISVGQDTSPRTPERAPSSGTSHRVPGLEDACGVWSRHSNRASTLTDCLKKISQLDAETFGKQLSKTFASAPLPPSAATSHTVQLESILHLEEAIYREFNSAQPALLSIQNYLERIAPEGSRLLQLVTNISAGLRELADATTAKPLALKLTLIDEIVRNSSILMATYEETAETIAKELRSLRHVRPTTPQDSELWRQATLAIALHDLTVEMSPQSHTAPVLSNELLTSLPLFYEIDTSKLITTLTETLEDSTLAETLVSDLVSTAKTHQTWRTLIQGELGLPFSAIQLIERKYPCEELQKLIAEYRESEIVHSLLRRAIIQENQQPCPIEDLREWARQLESYSSTLSSVERLAPGISPWRNPEFFMPPQDWEQHRAHLEQLRLDPAYPRQLFRLASLSAVLGKIDSIGGPDLGSTSVYLAMMMVYGFGIPSQVAQDSNSKFELTSQASRIYSQDMARIAPAVQLAKLSAADNSLNSVLEDCVIAGLIKRISPSSSPAEKYFQLTSAAQTAPQWRDVMRIIRILRAETYAPEALTAQGQHSKLPSASSQRSRQSSSVTKRQEKTIANLQKELRAIEDTLTSLPATTRDHLVKKQIDTLISAASRIGEALTSLDVVSSTPELRFTILILTNLLKPTRTTDQSKLLEHCKTAKTALYLLKDLAAGTPLRGGKA
jgi:hypothetical protein